MKGHIFRKVSLDRLSSPEQLDQVMAVTSPRGWLALAAVGILLSAAIIWSVVGGLSEKVAGRGILVRSGGVLEVAASAGGRVTDVPVQVGDSIRQGQTVAWVAQPDLLDQIQRTKSQLADLRETHEETVAFSRQDAQLMLQALRQRRSNLEQSIRADGARLEALEERLQSEQELLERGLVAQPTLLATREQRDHTKEKIRSNESEISQISVEELTVESRLRETIRKGELQIARVEEQLQHFERQLGLSSQVASPYSGRVLELMTERGKIIDRGEPVLSLDLTGNSVQDLVAVIYVPSVHGKKIKPGMEIQIAPTTVAQEEYGMMLGQVTFASSFPATPRGMLRLLKNEQLVEELSGGGAPYEVHAELRVDPDTPSRYRWTSSRGPSTTIQSGTVASGFITVESQRPITRVFPVLRNWDREPETR